MLHYSAGALTVQPILCLTGQTQPGSPLSVTHSTLPDVDKLEALATLAQRSHAANVLPSLLVCTALLPLLLQSSAPRIVVFSSVAAEIPAPTRAIYAANKAALSMLLRSLRIELEGLVASVQIQPRKTIGITIVHPASINTGLRTSALDASSDSEQPRERKAMSPLYVAQRTVSAIARGQDEVWLPDSYWWISKVAMILVPGLVKSGAKRKYGFA